MELLCLIGFGKQNQLPRSAGSKIEPSGSSFFRGAQQFEHKFSDGSLDGAAKLARAVARIVDGTDRLLDQIGRKAPDIDPVRSPVDRKQLRIEFTGDQPQVFRLERPEDQDFMVEFAETGDEFGRKPLFQLHLQTLLQPTFAEVFCALEKVSADIGGGDQEKAFEIVGAIVVERDPRGIQLLQKDREKLRMRLFDFIIKDDALVVLFEEALKTARRFSAGSTEQVDSASSPA